MSLGVRAAATRIADSQKSCAARLQERRPPRAPYWRRLLLFAALSPLWAPIARATETCRFTGTTDYAGQVSLTTTAETTAGTTRVDVALQFDATTPLWLHLRYLFEEISEWRNATLIRLDANTRYVFAGRLVRQQWDDFRAIPDALVAFRIEGKRQAQFTQQYPGFAGHWDPAAFAAPWLRDFASAAPVRRPDLDLKSGPHAVLLQSPFALAFYWVRFLHPGAQHVPVFLPGFKTDKLADIALTPIQAAHGHAWQAELHHPWLSPAPPSTAMAYIAPDGRLDRLSFVLHGAAGSAGGTLRQAGCTGAP